MLAVAIAAFVAMAPEEAQAYAIDGLYEQLALILLPPALLALIGGLFATSYVRAVVVAAILGVCAIAVLSYSSGVLSLDRYHAYGMLVLVLIGLFGHALRRAI
jgi:hypothetical protein